MDKRILKTIVMFIIALIGGLVMPVFGQWYKQQTGIYPAAFYGLYVFGSAGISIVVLAKIWGGIE